MEYPGPMSAWLTMYLCSCPCLGKRTCFFRFAAVGTGSTAVAIGVPNDVFVKWQNEMERVNGTINCTTSLLLSPIPTVCSICMYVFLHGTIVFLLILLRDHLSPLHFYI